MKKRIVIIGAGPIGLEAALYATELGYPVTVLEKKSIGAHFLEWGHVTLFSPWKMNHSLLGPRLLRAHNPSWQEPDAEAYMTGREFVETYLLPLSELPQLADKIHQSVEVKSIGREGLLKGDLIGNPDRAKHPFRILATDREGHETLFSADILIDTTGVYGSPNYLGDGGIPAPGEVQCLDLIDYKMPGIYGADREKFSGKKTLLIGAGYSAATVICDFQNLIREEPASSVLWVTRKNNSLPIEIIANDPLYVRAHLTKNANAIAKDGSANVQFLNNSAIESLSCNTDKTKVAVALKSTRQIHKVEVDRIIATVGFHPDNSIYRELQVHECYASSGPMKLAAALLSNSSTNCLSQQSQGAETLKNPEPNFYIIGNKSYGRNSTFLLQIGLNQIVEIFSLITGDKETSKVAVTN